MHCWPKSTQNWQGKTRLKWWQKSTTASVTCCSLHLSSTRLSLHAFSYVWCFLASYSALCGLGTRDSWLGFVGNLHLELNLTTASTQMIFDNSGIECKLNPCPRRFLNRGSHFSVLSGFYCFVSLINWRFDCWVKGHPACVKVWLSSFKSLL